ncbi:hypothetical protein A3D85_00125 [Candidatus Amesbacteria bacterium RIFCSPHIGHO2_02_FULL_47_9]|uniref:Glutaredoxin domain-containing protein n=1 Tax=Candidatus Amesbacteria bacterium RIFCSPHIGHO2_01_FULL_48_32b TaxID=1797253 RepID=A0A1F4YFK0_9BACT|nr:MAG: hypothetical protein A2876_00040 [Candidatus Amesbacteria bacterium RIFCSPHIGHO2_01_FULL_48_32b]OGD04994.1 MAG: hypothetical protein A3D85_00125 [Candidatus Amesbacteria bacterium RIFCSPHIGHO2_02_FULL_47_9]OGD07122.1 MAG: hypothetical protein A2899_00890 [Candidatus Amesbacteria bacterium RIFCSPLOWO2_01_FULL_49_25]
MAGHLKDSDPNILVFGGDWCKDTRRVLNLIEALGLLEQSVYVAMDRDKDGNAGLGNEHVSFLVYLGEEDGRKVRIPIVSVKGKRLNEPTNEELVDVLVAAGMLGGA